MYKVTSFKICPFFQYVNAALLATKTPFQTEYLVFDNCLFEISPNGKAPILTTPSNEVLFDADAITSYLTNQNPYLYQGNTPEQQTVLQAWANYGSKNYVPQCSTMRSNDKNTFKTNLAIFNKALNNIENQLSETPYFAGIKLSIVDIAWLPILYRSHLVAQKTKFDFLSEFPKLKQWQQNLLALPFIRKSVSEDFETIFADFYLTNTYLSTVN